MVVTRSANASSSAAASTAMDADVGGKRKNAVGAALADARERVKKVNDAVHSPMKVKPEVEEDVHASMTPGEKVIFGALSKVIDEVENKVATKQDIHESEKRVALNVAEQISAAVDPLKEEISLVKQQIDADITEMRKQIIALESKRAVSTSSQQISDLMRQVDALDENHRRVAFLGLPDACQEQDRIAKIEALLKEKVPNIKYTHVTNIFKGPYNNRKLSQNSYAEFPCVADVKKVLEALKDVQFEVSGKAVVIKQSKTKLQSKRNWSLSEAEKLLKEKASDGVEVQLEWKERVVKVNGIIAFKQNKTDSGGTFSAPFTSLALP